jgi:hypothetical protein
MHASDASTACCVLSAQGQVHVDYLSQLHMRSRLPARLSRTWAAQLQDAGRQTPDRCQQEPGSKRSIVQKHAYSTCMHRLI